MDDTLSWGGRVSGYCDLLFLPRSCLGSLRISISANKVTCKLHGVVIFLHCSPGAGFPHMCSLLQAAPVFNQDSGG